ncbi:MAG: DUF2268 domain-containing putative Zn-dependent protease [Pseudomonadota bacterium]
MTVRIHMHNALGRISDKLESEILAGVHEGVQRMKECVEVDNVDISIVLEDFVDEVTGYGGMACGPEYCRISVDPLNPDLGKYAHDALPAVTVHELHHVLRMRSFKLKGLTKGWCGASVIALEGLATQAEKFLGFGVPNNVNGVSVEQTITFLQKLKPIAEDEEADYYWIYELNGMPKRTYRVMYPMGYHLVGAYLQKTGKSPIKALCDPWKEIWETGMKELGL